MVPEFLTIAEAAALIGKRELSPVELTESRLARIERFDGRLHSFIRVLREPALAAARRAEAEIMAGNYRGPLHGIPIGLKDIYETMG
ncbi:MAG TPA: amidase family protein, partial [Stellaceae bacterium]|nr:amidase family protein [Stellaceae bacterium]